jgi:hypothetical protein
MMASGQFYAPTRWAGGWVGIWIGPNHTEKWKFLTLPELQPLGRPARSL